MNLANEFVPSVPAAEIEPELTVRSVVLGAILGVVFGAASTFLALRVGLTTSASAIGFDIGQEQPRLDGRVKCVGVQRGLRVGRAVAGMPQDALDPDDRLGR